MVNPKSLENLSPATSQNAAERGALGGRAKKGKKHINTWIQEFMEDEDFEANVLDAKKGYVEYKGAPVKAIVGVAITKAVNGDLKAMEWLAKYGWSQKFETDVTSLGESVSQPLDQNILTQFLMHVQKDTKR